MCIDVVFLGSKGFGSCQFELARGTSDFVDVYLSPRCLMPQVHPLTVQRCHESELWKSKAGVLVYKDRGGLRIDLSTGQN